MVRTLGHGAGSSRAGTAAPPHGDTIVDPAVAPSWQPGSALRTKLPARGPCPAPTVSHASAAAPPPARWPTAQANELGAAVGTQPEGRRLNVVPMVIAGAFCLAIGVACIAVHEALKNNIDPAAGTTVAVFASFSIIGGVALVGAPVVVCCVVRCHRPC